MMQLFGGDQEYLTEKYLYNLLGIKNQLTDDEMNISNALMSDAAKKAISNINYSNGVNTFHYYGVSGYEGINWLFKVSPSTNYRMVIVASSTSEITALDNMKPYIPWVINSKENLNDPDSTYGDIANGHSPLPWSGWTSESIFFNSGSYNNLYLNTNFGFINDGVDTGITLRIKLFKADSIQDQIDSSFSTRDTQINTLGQTITNNFTADRSRLCTLEGAQTLYSPDFNSITASGVYYITNNTPANIKNNPIGTWGVLVVANGNGSRISQVYYPDDGSAPWYRIYGVGNSSTWQSWYQLSNQNDVTSLQNEIISNSRTFNIFDHSGNNIDTHDNRSIEVAMQNVMIDPSLAEQNEAADAKAVGDALASMQNQINQQNQTIQSLIMRLTNPENKVGGTSA